MLTEGNCHNNLVSFRKSKIICSVPSHSCNWLIEISAHNFGFGHKILVGLIPPKVYLINPGIAEDIVKKLDFP